ncbi:ornithine carbamoyltransferase [Algiphilus aromaticivorans]|jgi:ornithine carbamoyltransferase|uniref:ornithine carbamoyltransferase n=1 Tax=Algiphilus aromaticivorans TaxID=382454 RepID=UPI000694AC07|nr:ornithine carbamoyltransferase [Algiphilus aromaticivorans]
MSPPHHFLRLSDLPTETLSRLIDRAIALKNRRDPQHRPLLGKVLAMVFAKSSTRTRVSFETAMAQLGGHALFLSPRDTQLGRGEPVEDTTRVLSSMCDAVMVRNDSQAQQAAMAAVSTVPIINGLSEACHPCQLLADIQTVVEARGSIEGARVAWIGDGNNVCHSWLEAASLFGFELRVATPEGFEPDPDWVAAAGEQARLLRDPAEASEGADVVVTDVWASMGQEEEHARRCEAFAGYRVDEALMTRATSEAIFLHCLPAHRGEEVDAAVIDGPRSRVWQEAENRLHAQKALLEALLAPAGTPGAVTLVN